MTHDTRLNLFLFLTVADVGFRFYTRITALVRSGSVGIIENKTTFDNLFRFTLRFLIWEG